MICFDNCFNVATKPTLGNAHRFLHRIFFFFFFFRADWRQVFVIQWVWWKDQKTLSDQDSLWQNFLSSAGRLVSVFSASQSRNSDDFYFLLRSCDGAQQSAAVPYRIVILFVISVLRYVLACMHRLHLCVSVCVCVCVFQCVYGGSVSRSVCFQCFRDLPGSPPAVLLSASPSDALK